MKKKKRVKKTTVMTRAITSRNAILFLIRSEVLFCVTRFYNNSRLMKA